MRETDDEDAIVLRAGGSLVQLQAKPGERLRMLYCGPEVTGAAPADLAELGARAHAPGGPEDPIEPSLLNTIGTGHPSPPGLLVHRDGRNWAIDLRVSDIELPDDDAVLIGCNDAAAQVRTEHSIAIDAESGVVTVHTTVSNDGAERLTVEWAAAAVIPLDERLTHIRNFTGRWAEEFQIEEVSRLTGSFVRENRAGRTSHDCYPGLYLGTEATSETNGLAAAAHLGWSGNHRSRVDTGADGSVSLQMGELLLPGEIILEPGQSYATPAMTFLISDMGYSDVTRRLHRYVTSRLTRADQVRSVHYNTWEPVYFDHSEERMLALAGAAADVGAERFVLDDGWFGARRSDRAGLGDWFVAHNVYPSGLEAIADRVRDLGMEFGLWLEPEMVNPDSDLYREHPEWVLGVRGVEPIASRHQLALDLTRAEVCDYLFERIDRLVRDLGIAYIKWDMNRDIQHPGDGDGRPVMHRQVRALYALIDRIRAAHPELVIESCASGGGRADYGILRRTDRVWPSDNNDARARHSIMCGAAYFLPLAVLGNHVGPKSCHITGRSFGMDFRAGSAIFGHMGLELDLNRETETDREVLRSAITLHKRHRALIHDGEYHRLETPTHISAVGCVANDKAAALFQCAVLDQHPASHPPRLRLAGLDAERRYRLSCIWPKAIGREIGAFSGDALVQHGYQLPQTYPDTCLIYHLEAAQ